MQKVEQILFSFNYVTFKVYNCHIKHTLVLKLLCK